MKGVCGFREGLLRIMSALWGRVCFGDRAGGGGGGGSRGLGKCGEFGSGGSEEDDFLGEEALEGEGWIACEGRLEDADFGGYEEFLVGDGDGQLGFDDGGKITDC